MAATATAAGTEKELIQNRISIETTATATAGAYAGQATPTGATSSCIFSIYSRACNTSCKTTRQARASRVTTIASGGIVSSATTTAC